MKNFLENKLVTILVISATIILALVAIFTALRLYRLRQTSVAPSSPESTPLALDCTKYTFSVSPEGVVSVRNDSGEKVPAQKARVFINDSLVASFDVPELPSEQSTTLGTVQIPGSRIYTWRVEGSLGCSNSGSFGPVACKPLTFSPAGQSTTPTTTQTPTPTLTPSATPTQQPQGRLSPTPIPSQTPTPTSQRISASSPTPTEETIPNAGTTVPTWLVLTLGVLGFLVSSLTLVI